MKYLAAFVAAVITAILYRLSGSGVVGKQWRRAGVPFVCLIYMVLFSRDPWVVRLISTGLLYAAITTYWDFIDGTDNFYTHGFGIGLAYLPFAISSGCWWQWGVRTLLLTLGMGLWCKYFENVWAEEGFRGGIIALTLPILLL